MIIPIKIFAGKINRLTVLSPKPVKMFHITVPQPRDWKNCIGHQSINTYQSM